MPFVLCARATRFAYYFAIPGAAAAAAHNHGIAAATVAGADCFLAATLFY